MELPVSQPDRMTARSGREIRAMAIAVQANLVQLKVAAVKRRGLTESLQAIRVSSPGTVREFRETLIDRRVLRDYSEFELEVRLRELWGQYCVMCWLFEQVPSRGDVDFARLPTDAIGRCDTEIEIKHAAVHALLWCLRFEQRRRHDIEYAASPSFQRDQLLTAEIPATAFGKDVTDCTDEELLLGGCEFAGMLATLRWVLDRECCWGEAGTMEVGERP